MKLTEAKFTKRYNTGDYEFEELSLSALAEDGDSGTGILCELKADIEKAFTGEIEEKLEEKKPPAKRGRKPKAKKEKENNGKSNNTDRDEDSHSEASEAEDAGNDGESNQDDESSDTEADNNRDSVSEESDDSNEDGQEDEKPKRTSKERGARKTYSKKPQAYDRNIEEHKELFGSTLRLIAPDWKKSEDTKMKAKAVSQAMEGKDFIDVTGEVLPSFKAEVKKRMGAK